MSIKLRGIILHKRCEARINQLDDFQELRPKVQPVMMLDTPSLKLMYFYNTMNSLASNNLYDELSKFYSRHGLYGVVNPYYQYDDTWTLDYDNSERNIQDVVNIILNKNYIIILYRDDEMLIPLVRKYNDYHTLNGETFAYQINKFNKYSVVSYSEIDHSLFKKESYMVRLNDYDNKNRWYLFNNIEELKTGVYKWLESKCLISSVRDIYDVVLSIGGCESLVEVRDKLDRNRLLFTFLLHHIKDRKLVAYELRADIPYPKYVIISDVGWYKILTSFSSLIKYLKKYNGILYDIAGGDATIFEINHTTRDIIDLYDDFRFIHRIVLNERIETSAYNLVEEYKNE